MTRYRIKDPLDDPILPDGDNGWIGFETRRHATILEPGIARFSQNQRFEDSVSRVRKGIDRITSDLRTASQTPLTLPFNLGTFVSVSTLVSTGTAATCTTSAAHGYSTGDTVEIAGANEGDYNGEFVITVTGTTTFTFTLGADPVDTATGTITVANHPILLADLDGVHASTLFSDPETNKEYVAIATFDRVTLVDPDDTTNNVDVLYPGASCSESLDSNDPANLVQVNYGLLLFRGPRRSPLEWDGNVSNTSSFSVTSITRSGTVATVTTPGEHGYKAGENVLIAGANQSDYNGTVGILSIPTSTTFTYAVANSPATPATGTITVVKVPQFTAVSDTSLSAFLSIPWASFGVYHTLARLVVPVENITLTLSSLVRSGTVITGTTAINHGLELTDRITIEAATQSDYNGTFEVTGTTATTFTYSTSATPATPATGTPILKMAVRDQFIVSDVFDHRTYDPVNNLFRINRGTADHLVGLQPFQNDNFIALYRNSINLVTGMSLATLEDSSTFLITDEVGCIARKTAVIIGDRLIFLSEQGVYSIGITPEINLRGQDIPLSLDVEDQIESINWAVASDAVATYFNNRYYIALPEGERIATNDTVTTDGATVTVNTLENHGFNEGDTIVMAGMTPAGFDASATITLVDRNTFTYANATVGPITVAGTSTKAASTRNNVVFIYNFLNGKWESKDTFGAEGSFIDDFVVCNKSGKKRLFGTSVEGAVQLWEELDHDEIGPLGGPFLDVEIPGQLITRRYTQNDPFDVKKYMKGSIDFDVLANDEFSITATTENPDSTATVATYSSLTTKEDHFRSFRINKRGRGCEIQIDSTVGRPEIRQITVQATVLQRANKSFE